MAPRARTIQRVGLRTVPYRSALRVTASAIIGIAALTGCGDDGEDPPAEEPTTTTEVVAPQIPTDSESYATAFVDAWSSGDREYADVLGTDEAVDTIFAFEGGGTWTLVDCEGAMGSSYCTYSAGGDSTLIIRVGNEAAGQGEPDAINEVRIEG
jgi:hypothetical protein